MDVEKKRENLTPAEKREQRYQWWLNPEIKFSSPEAEKNHRQRALRFINAYRVEKSDRVPVELPVQNWPAWTCRRSSTIMAKLEMPGFNFTKIAKSISQSYLHWFFRQEHMSCWTISSTHGQAAEFPKALPHTNLWKAST
jgi:hypothetical protein